MILPTQTIRKLALAGMIVPFEERGVSHGRTYGLGPCTYDVRLRQDLWLWPFWGRLASTVETFDMPNDIVAEVKDKSSNARIFVLVQNTLIDPGFRGGLTLELTRFLPWPIRLRAGTPIAQLKFSRLEEPTEAPYRGRYYDQSTNPEPIRYEGNVNTPPSYCCQHCGKQIGWLGRGLLAIGLPMGRLYPNCRSPGRCR